MAAAFARQKTPPLVGNGRQLLGNRYGGHVCYPRSRVNARLGQGKGIAEGEIAVDGLLLHLGRVNGVAVYTLPTGGVKIRHVGHHLVLLGANLGQHPHLQMEPSVIHLHRHVGAVAAGRGGAGGDHPLHANGAGEGDLPLQDGELWRRFLGNGLSRKLRQHIPHGVGGAEGELYRYLTATAHRPRRGKGLGHHDLPLGADHPHLSLGGGENDVVPQRQRLAQRLIQPPYGDFSRESLYRWVAVIPAPRPQRALSVGSYTGLDLATDAQPSWGHHPPHGYLRGQVAQTQCGLAYARRHPRRMPLHGGFQTVFGGQGRAVYPTVHAHVEDIVVHTPHKVAATIGIGREQVHPNAQKLLDLGLVIGKGEITGYLGGHVAGRVGELYRPTPCRLSHVFVHHVRISPLMVFQGKCMRGRARIEQGFKLLFVGERGERQRKTS